MGEVRRWRVCGLAGCAEVRARVAKNDCTRAWLGAKAERQRPGVKSRQGKAGQGRARLGARQGMATGETGREEEQDAKSPHWVSESCSFVRYPALLFPLSSVSSRVFGDVAGIAAGQQGGSWSWCGGHFFFVFFFLFGCTRLLLLLLLFLMELQHMPGVVSSAVFLSACR